MLGTCCFAICQTQVNEDTSSLLTALILSLPSPYRFLRECGMSYFISIKHEGHDTGLISVIRVCSWYKPSTASTLSWKSESYSPLGAHSRYLLANDVLYSGILLALDPVSNHQNERLPASSFAELAKNDPITRLYLCMAPSHNT